ncbi:hypothetical protein FDP41_013175 [Naegleria fowleri]|uniref:Uncharacterized protein n=1 Tax=Naegleria fowleri TaxID=5763 RepID=A0A6A5C1P8_NAEFO|nr:uncharacterized protein FDP41_013175 [Naegleria fowleri]KAF0980692.1 hypothetical protein FDP41_013175 [Naegleria fowleri]CAG4709055.1 unnamed protein product [Naegleria fowleri]
MKFTATYKAHHRFRDCMLCGISLLLIFTGMLITAVKSGEKSVDKIVDCWNVTSFDIIGNITLPFETIKFTNISYGKVLTIRGEIVGNNGDVNAPRTSSFGFYASIDKIPTKKDYHFYIPMNTNFSAFSKGSERAVYYGISGPVLSGAASFTYVLNVLVHDPKEMPQSILSIILTSGIVILILVISTFVIQTGISLSIVSGVDFCAMCRKRKKHGYAQIDTVFTQQQE